MTKLSNKHLLIAFILIVTMGIGYFVFIYRPQELRRHCQELAKNEFNRGTYKTTRIDDVIYKNCLKDFGLSNEKPKE